MNNIILIILLISLCVASPIYAFSDSSWLNFENTYNDAVINRPVTNKEFDKALEQKKSKSANKKQKKNKFKKPEGSPTSTITFEDSRNSSSPLSLLRLTCNVVFNGKIIQNGYYLVDYDKNSITLFQGENMIAKFKAVQSKTDKFLEEKTIKTEIINNSIVKISIFHYNSKVTGYLKIIK